MARPRKAKSEFGTYLVELIRKADMVQSDFYDAVGIKKPCEKGVCHVNVPITSAVQRLSQ